jgi:hypothetical protein
MTPLPHHQPQEKEMDEALTIEELKQALKVAANALSIADDWNLPCVQAEPPKEWNLDGGGEDPADGWCSTMALVDKLRELAES